VTLKDGSTIKYDKLCLATGGKARVPPLKGIDAKNVHTLRDANDQSEIKAKTTTAKSVAIIGGSFIGSESAAALKMKYKDAQAVHLIYGEHYPLERVFGPEVGKIMEKEHRENGVTLHPKAMVTEIKKNEAGEAIAVVL